MHIMDMLIIIRDQSGNWEGEKSDAENGTQKYTFHITPANQSPSHISKGAQVSVMQWT